MMMYRVFGGKNIGVNLGVYLRCIFAEPSLYGSLSANNEDPKVKSGRLSILSANNEDPEVNLVGYRSRETRAQ